MTNWYDTLSDQAARHSATEPTHVRDFGRILSVGELANGFVAVLGDQGLIAVSGDDAATFLHNQLTNDVTHLGAGEARLAAYCTPKGRMQASFLMWRTDAAVFLQLPREIQAPLQKRLSMFVMRSKAKLVDANAPGANIALLGFGGVRAGQVLEQMFGTIPAAAYGKLDHALGTLIRLPDAFGAPRFEWIASEQAAQAAWPALSTALTAAGADAWRLSEIHAGVPTITLKTQEQFVPQMVNFELLGGVNFKKGCYPGQEIVARSQYLGKLKRRAMLASIDNAEAQPGDEVFSVADPEEPCGMVVNAAPNGNGGVDALVEIKLVAFEDGDVRLGSAAGPALRFQSLPYLLDAIAV
ncbi:MAG TPA: folate-binding protein [Telluria sp.]